MIRKETWKIKVSADTAATKAAFEKPGSSYDTQKGELSFDVNVATKDVDEK